MVSYADFIIPAIDLIDGKCVRLAQGDFLKTKIYSDDPVSMAMKLEDVGLKRLHLVDLDGAKSGEVKHLEVLRKIAERTRLKIDFGGGIKTENHFCDALSAGASIVVLGSIALHHTSLVSEWSQKYGSDKILLSADVVDGQIAYNGWQKISDKSVLEFIGEYRSLGIQSFFSTDVTMDGMLSGPSYDLYRNILNQIPEIKLLASGGISCLSDIQALMDLGCSGAIVGKALYEGHIELDEIKTMIAHAG